MKIICGTDFSVHANSAALTAATLAARLGATLTLVHVVNPKLYRNVSTEFMDYVRQSRQKKLDPLAERARRKGANVEAIIVEGSPVAKLAELASRPDVRFLVLSSAGQIAPTQWLAGSVTDGAAQSAIAPTLVVRDAKSFEAWLHGKRPLSVLVGYDFSPSAEAALRWSASLREIAPIELTVAYVASTANERGRLGIAPPLSPLYYPSGLKKFLEKELKQAADAVLGENAATVCVKADWGRSDSQLIETAAESKADLIVTGTSQRRGLARLGSISRAVLHYAPMNVVCVPAPAVQQVIRADASRFKRVLVPIDFSESAEQAIPFAFNSVDDGGEVRFVHVIPTANGNGNDEQREKHRDRLARLKALVPQTARTRGIRVESEVVEHAEPSVAICQAADRFDAELTCIGSRGRSRLRETLFGSVSREVMARSGRAVLVIRGAAQQHTNNKQNN